MGEVYPFVRGRMPTRAMSSPAQIAPYVLWVSHAVLHIAVVTTILRRKLRSVFPAFLAYNAYEVLAFAVLFPISLTASYTLYFFAYWIHAAIGLTLGFLVIHEIFQDVFRPYHTLRDLGTMVFKWAALVMLVVAGVVAAASANSEQGPLVQSVLTVQRCVRIIQFGLILFLLLFSKYVGISRRRRSFGIALGFGFYAGVELLIVSLRASASISESALNLINSTAFCGTMIIWLVYFRVTEERRQPTSVLLTSQRWEESLADIQHPMPADSLIPMFESMVEQAFSHRSSDQNSGVLSTLSPPSASHQLSESLERSPHLHGK